MGHWKAFFTGVRAMCVPPAIYVRHRAYYPIMTLNWRSRTLRLIHDIGRASVRHTPLWRSDVTTKTKLLLFRIGSDAGRVTHRGLTFSGPTDQYGVAHGLFFDEFEQINLDVFEALAEHSSLIVDAGANIGIYSCLGGARLPQSGRVIAFEPVPDTLRYLKDNIRANGLSERVVVESAAVGAEDSVLTINLHPKGNTMHGAACVPSGATRAGAVVTPMVSLDSYFSAGGTAEPDLMKIDVEGYDGFALEGARDLIERARPTLFVEFIPENLEACSYPAPRMLDLIYDWYPHVYALDTVCGRLVTCSKEFLLSGIPPKVRSHFNDLLAVSRPLHHRLICRRWSPGAAPCLPAATGALTG
ncbi:FkbM family methyltransferase [Streptomyces sp. NPDC004546]|uniref:FkbM family methyltransferase n=1 Tax=unclassified Streptomyces TaxID=2593676 RepID=UPI0033B5CC65